MKGEGGQTTGVWLGRHNLPLMMDLGLKEPTQWLPQSRIGSPSNIKITLLLCEPIFWQANVFWLILPCKSPMQTFNHKCLNGVFANEGGIRYTSVWNAFVKTSCELKSGFEKMQSEICLRFHFPAL